MNDRPITGVQYLILKKGDVLSDSVTDQQKQMLLDNYMVIPKILAHGGAVVIKNR